MIERKLLAQRLKEFRVHEYIKSTLRNVGHSSTKIIRTPLGEKIIIRASRPGLVVGRKGENIKKLTSSLKRQFKLENPEIELEEVKQPDLDAAIISERIASNLERFGVRRFKGVGHRMLSSVMQAGARGVEILISGKIPSSRSRTWRFYAGYLKKSGDVAVTQLERSYATANLKSGAVGIKVTIMPPDTRLPDDMEVAEAPEVVEQTPGAVPEKLKEDPVVEAAAAEEEATPEAPVEDAAAPEETVSEEVVVAEELPPESVDDESADEKAVKDEATSDEVKDE